MQELEKKLEGMELELLIVEFNKIQLSSDGIAIAYKNVIDSKVMSLIETSLHSSELLDLFYNMENISYGYLKETLQKVKNKIQDLLIIELDDFKKNCRSVSESMKVYKENDRFFDYSYDNPYFCFHKDMAEIQSEEMVKKSSDVYFIRRMMNNGLHIQTSDVGAISIYSKKIRELEWGEFWSKIMSCTSLEEARKLQYNIDSNRKEYYTIARENIDLFYELEYENLYEDVKKALKDVSHNSDIGRRYKDIYEVLLEEDIMNDLEKEEDINQVLKLMEKLPKDSRIIKKAEEKYIHLIGAKKGGNDV